MKKKIIAIALVACIAVTAIVSASLAYFTDTDEATNVMTIGDVSIELHEKQKVNDTDGDGALDVEEFKDEDFVLYPLSNEKGVQLVNKQVDVENTSSKDPVYIRTIVAIEDWYEGEEDVMGVRHTYYNTLVNEEVYNDVVIDGKEYDVLVFTHVNGEAYEVGAKQYSLQGVWFDKDLTQEQIAKYYGEKLEILVFAQGIQSVGLTHAEAMEALGEINSENLSAWFDTTGVVGNVIPETTAAN